MGCACNDGIFAFERAMRFVLVCHVSFLDCIVKRSINEASGLVISFRKGIRVMCIGLGRGGKGAASGRSTADRRQIQCCVIRRIVVRMKAMLL